MTVSQLKELLVDAPDDMDVLIATDETHWSPILEFSGIATFPAEAQEENGKDYTFFVLTSNEDLELLEDEI